MSIQYTNKQHKRKLSNPCEIKYPVEDFALDILHCQVDTLRDNPSVKEDILDWVKETSPVSDNFVFFKDEIKEQQSVDRSWSAPIIKTRTIQTPK